LQGKAHIPLDLLGWISQVGRPEGDVLVNRRGKELIIGVLEDHAHRSAHGPQACRIVLQWPAGKKNLSGAGTEDAVDHQHEGGLACSIGPHQCHLGSLLQADVYVLQSQGAVSIGEAEIPDLDDIGHCRHSREASLLKTAMVEARAK